MLLWLECGTWLLLSAHMRMPQSSDRLTHEDLLLSAHKLLRVRPSPRSRCVRRKVGNICDQPGEPWVRAQMLGDEDRLERLRRSAELLQPWSTGNRQTAAGRTPNACLEAALTRCSRLSKKHPDSHNCLAYLSPVPLRSIQNQRTM